MKLISYNVNGIRAAITKGFVTWLQEENPDIICIQELKAEIEQVDLKEIFALGYEVYWHSAQKKGYSGVAIFSKIRPNNVSVGCGIDKYDAEGRVLRADYDGFSVMSVYMPSGSSGDERQAFKMDWLGDFQNYINALKIEFPNLVIAGDYNICHKAIDIHNPKGNANSSGFLPEEREWMDGFVSRGFVDSFRAVNEEPHHYSWWSYRSPDWDAGDKGRRLDHIWATKDIASAAHSSRILRPVRGWEKGSDHVPVFATFDL